MSGAVLNTIGRTVYRLGFEISPIILSNGIAKDLPQNFLPLVVITEAANLANNLVGGVLSGTFSFSLDDFFAHFSPIPGATLINNALGKYPFATQQTAANAIIAQPLTISMLMKVPVNKPGGHVVKFITFMALKRVLDLHANAGGTYTVVTPTYIYTNCILTGLRDVSSGESAIPQNTWQFDFEQPLVTMAQAQAAQNSLMSKVSNGTQTDGSLSGPAVSASSPLTGAAPSSTPTAANTVGTSTGGAVPQTQAGGFT